MVLLSEERLAVIINAIHRYVNKYMDVEVADYYDMFGFSRNMSAEEIDSVLKEKKYKLMFHPDLIGNLPERLKPYFTQVCTAYKDFEAIIAIPYKKVEYDRKLSSYEQVNEDETVKLEDEEDKDMLERRRNAFSVFGKYVLSTMAKYGKGYVVNEITNYLTTGYLNGFTRTQNARQKIISLDRKSVIRILQDCYRSKDSHEIATVLVEDALRLGLEAIEEALLITSEKYGPNQSEHALKKLVKLNKFDGFTNQFGARDNLVNSEVSVYTLPYLLAYGLNYEDYVNYPAKMKVDELELIGDYMRVIEEKVKNRRQGFRQ